MLRLIAFFFGGLVLANVVIVTFETARSAIANKQVSAGVEQKPSGAGSSKPVQPAGSKPAPKADAEAPRHHDWVYSERFNAHAEARQPSIPPWLRTQ